MNCPTKWLGHGDPVNSGGMRLNSPKKDFDVPNEQ
jgi:hypothetical protein